MKLRHHGDVLLTTALFRALRAHFPEAMVDVLIYHETRPLLENNPDIHHVYTIDRKLKGWKRITHELGLLLTIRHQRYDAVIHLTDQWIGALIARTCKAPVRVQMFYAKRDKPFWHNSFTHRITPPARGEAHAVELNLMSLKALGINPQTVQGQLVLHPTTARMKEAQQRLIEAGIRQPYVLIHPAARWPFKCWEDDKFAQVTSWILNKGFDVVLSCSPDPVEIAMTQRIETLTREKGCGHAHLVNWGGQLNLPLLGALIEQCRFYVGVDSAPMHMAAALNKPQVALFGPSWVNEWRPWSKNATVIYAGDFGPLPHPDSINTDDPTRLLAAIPVDKVIDAIEHLAENGN